jgi:hypothetical protein
MRVLPMTGPSSLTAPEVAVLVSEVLGKAVAYIPGDLPPPGPYRDLWDFLRAGGFDHCDPTLERLLGRPARPLADTMREHAASMM